MKGAISAPPLGWLLAAGLAAAALHLAGITWGLPNTFNADEPHLVNLAVSFGGGSLKPYAFKYPTLWPYLLFFFYGLYFLLWSCLGLRHGVSEFAGLFAWHPAEFYLIGRLLSALFSLLGILVVWRMEKETRREGLPWAALLLAFSPVLVELSHSCKPDNLMFFFASVAWYYALKIYREGTRRSHWACGAFLGLAMSSQYTALPLALILPLAHAFGRKKCSRRYLAEGLAAAAAGFFAGSPFILLDFPRFWANLKDLSDLAALESWDRGAVLRRVVANLGAFSSVGSVAGLAALLGLVRLVEREKDLALVLLGPIVLYVLILANNPDGGWPRYLLGCYPALALLASEGLVWIHRPGRPLWTLLLVVAALFPGFCRSAIMDLEMMRADTREEVQAWVEKNVPAESVLLLDLPHASPNLVMMREEVLELWQKTLEAGSPRSRLYRAMADAHPGGGYRLYRIQRSARDLYSYPRHVTLSQADAPSLDVSSGLGPARAAQVDYVVTSSSGANPERAPELAGFFEELYREGELIKVFASVPGKTAGPVLRVYRLHRS